MNPAIFFHPDQRLVALPGIGPVRMLVDARHTWSATRWYPAQRLLARAARTGVRLAALLRCGVTRERLCEEDTPRWVKELAPLRPTAVLIRTPGPAQKLTVRLDTPEGKPALFAKIAHRPAARRRLENEAAVLQALPAGFAPRPVAYHRFEDHDVLIMEALEGHVLRDTRRDGERARRYLEALAEASARPAEGDHPWLAHVREVIPELRPHVELLAGQNLSVVAVHGDFAPWNVLASDGRVVAIDWEYGTAEGLPGLDIAYWRLQADALLRRRPPVEARKRAAAWVAEALGWHNELGEALIRVTAAWARREALRDGHREHVPLLRWREEVAFG
jgi:aminoglycoside phosphotransferase (APT) family kinase protein